MFLDAPDFVNAPLNSALFRTAQRAWGGLRALHATADALGGPGWEDPGGRGWRTVFSWHLRLAVPACERGLHFEGVCGGAGAVGRRGGQGRWLLRMAARVFCFGQVGWACAISRHLTTKVS